MKKTSLVIVAFALALSLPAPAGAIEGMYGSTLSSHPSDAQVQEKQQQDRRLETERRERQELQDHQDRVEYQQREIIRLLEQQNRNKHP